MHVVSFSTQDCFFLIHLMWYLIQTVFMEQINKYDFLHGLKNNMDKEY